MKDMRELPLERLLDRESNIASEIVQFLAVCELLSL